MRNWLRAAVLLIVLPMAVAWWLTAPQPLPRGAVEGLTGDAARGETVFWAGGCASCHKVPGSDDPLLLAGGVRLASPFGAFVAPNISPDPEHGIGGWSAYDLANAMLRGVSPGGAHYFPAFPYTSYAQADLQDVVDLKAFLDTLPASSVASLPHEVGFPFNIRRTLGLWKRMFGNRGWVVEEPADPVLARGRYLAEGLGHCGECHTPRNALGGLETGRWMAGGPVPGSDKGRFPNLTPAKFDWSGTDIAYYLETGFTPDFDSAGGHMAEVVQNMGRLSAEDRAAIAAYLKALPAAE